MWAHCLGCSDFSSQLRGGRYTWQMLWTFVDVMRSHIRLRLDTETGKIEKLEMTFILPKQL